MTPATYERMWDVFDEARQRPRAGRAAFLDERCADNAELRAEVEKLLEQAEGEDPGPFAAPGPLTVKANWLNDREDPLIGRRVGPYEVQKLLGAGGMGCVYLAARCEDFRQRVAVKWIKPGLDADDVLRRFQNERQVLARLRHRSIAALLDGGNLDGRPYFVMEYVDGQPINEYCASRPLSITERVRLFLAVCAAVHYAHQSLVLHRDLKPGNILVDAAGVPILLDFGIAKVITPQDGDGLKQRTQTGRQFATLEYASPEQLTGSALPNTTGDIYSLGVILYEMLTGRRPHESGDRSPLEVARAVCEEEAPPLRRWHPDLPRDLEVICLRCLHKEPGRRFPSVAALEEELQRFLSGRPIQSRPIGVWERACKWARRRPAAAALVGVSALALLGVLALTLGYNRKLESAVAVATQARNDVQQEKDRADANLLITLGMLEKKLVGEKHGDQKEWLGRKKRQDLQEILDRFQVLSQINSGSPHMMQLRAQAYGQMAAIQELLGEYQTAERSLRQAQELQEALLAHSPHEPGYEHDLADTLNSLGRVLANARRVREAEEAYRGAIQLHQRLVEVSRVPAYRDALARHHHNLGNLLARDPARQQEARESFQEAIRLHEQLIAEHSELRYQESLNAHRYKLGILQGVGLKDKERLLRQRINELESRTAKSPAPPSQVHTLAAAYHDLGKLLALKAREAQEAAKSRMAGRPPEVDAMIHEAEDAFQRAVEFHESLARENPDAPRYQHGLAQHYVGLGDLFLWTARQPQKARAPYSAALDLFRKLAAQDATYRGDLGCAHEKMAQVWLRIPEPDRSMARDHLDKAVKQLQIALRSAPDNDHFRKILADATRSLSDLGPTEAP
jgi:serine/threonine protein kinase